ncbi:MAG: hypothetical protein KF778_23295, partial [Rhodocyclaceae bacterium]|nr:hypothetical protein [Rhodocyclaceae bacterium]
KDQTNNYFTNITPPPGAAATDPAILSLQVDLSQMDPDTGEVSRELVIHGTNFTDGGGEPFVNFLLPGPDGIDKTIAGNIVQYSNNEIHVQVPNTVTLGLARVVVSRANTVPVQKNGKVTNTITLADSNEARIKSEGTYAFVALPEARYTASGVEGVLAVLNGNPNSGVIGDLIAKIPIDTPAENPFPRDVALTPDNTRAYVTLRGSGRVAVIDTLTLQQLNVTYDQVPINGTLPTKGLAVDPGLYYASLSKPVAVRGTVDIPGLVSWKLDLVAFDGSATITLGQGTSKVNAGVLGQLDPASAAIPHAGFYRLELTAEDVGHVTRIDSSVAVYIEKNATPDIRLPFGAQPYGIAIDPAGKY